MEDNEIDFEVHFEIDEEDAFGGPDFCAFSGGRMVPLWELSPYNRMIVTLFVEGPPLGCVPGLN